MKKTILMLFLFILILGVYSLSLGFEYAKRGPDYTVSEAWKFEDEELLSILMEHIKLSGKDSPELNKGKARIFFDACDYYRSDCVPTVTIYIEYKQKYEKEN